VNVLLWDRMKMTVTQRKYDLELSPVSCLVPTTTTMAEEEVESLVSAIVKVVVLGLMVGFARRQNE
jgi:hypothetical protein